MKTAVYSNNPMISDEQAARYHRRIEQIMRKMRDASQDEIIEAVIADARIESSPLHEAYSWNKNEVFERYLRVQTQNIIRSIVVEIERPGQDNSRVRAFEIVTLESGRKIVGLNEIAVNPEAREQIAQRIHNDLMRAYTTYARYENELPEITQIKSVAQRFAKKMAA